MTYKIVAILASILLYSTLNAEPSAFGAGNINYSEPYGLTQEEEQLLENKKNLKEVSYNLKKVTVKSNNQSNELDSVRDRIDGLQDIIESLSRKEHLNKKSLRTLDEKNQLRLKNTDEYEKRLSVISQQNAQDIKEVKLELAALVLVVNKISKDYVTKAELNALIKDVNKFKDVVSHEFSGTSRKTEFSSKNKAQILKEAKQLYDEKQYTKAIKYYSYLIDKNYKPARAHYMIADMNFYKKNYAEAIAYYKKSAKLYSKASYMPLLMLNTAYSMKYIGDMKNAKVFFSALVRKYPSNKYAHQAKKELDLMN